jgi:hypothetical protein
MFNLLHDGCKLVFWSGSVLVWFLFTIPVLVLLFPFVLCWFVTAVCVFVLLVIWPCVMS